MDHVGKTDVRHESIVLKRMCVKTVTQGETGGEERMEKGWV